MSKSKNFTSDITAKFELEKLRKGIGVDPEIEPKHSHKKRRTRRMPKKTSSQPERHKKTAQSASVTKGLRNGFVIMPYCLPYNPQNKMRARRLRNNMTKPEKKLWYRFLRNHDTRVIRQHPIHHYIVDFYCPSRKLVIEVDGPSHYTKKGKMYDHRRTKALESYGITVVRFSNKDVMTNFDAVCEQLQKYLSPQHAAGVETPL